MNEMIKLYDLFGTEIRSRSNADVLREKSWIVIFLLLTYRK